MLPRVWFQGTLPLFYPSTNLCFYLKSLNYEIDDENSDLVLIVVDSADLAALTTAADDQIADDSADPAADDQIADGSEEWL